MHQLSLGCVCRHLSAAEAEEEADEYNPSWGICKAVARLLGVHVGPPCGVLPPIDEARELIREGEEDASRSRW